MPFLIILKIHMKNHIHLERCRFNGRNWTQSKRYSVTPSYAQQKQILQSSAL
jgi:hypothetical protein